MPKSKDKSKAGKTNAVIEQKTDINFRKFFYRIQNTLSNRVEDKRCYVVSIPFQSKDAYSSNCEKTVDITTNLMRRLEAKVDKTKAYLANFINEEGSRPLFIDELTSDENLATCDFTENDVLYISGHSNIVVFNLMNPLIFK